MGVALGARQGKARDAMRPVHLVFGRGDAGAIVLGRGSGPAARAAAVAALLAAMATLAAVGWHAVVLQQQRSALEAQVQARLAQTQSRQIKPTAGPPPLSAAQVDAWNSVIRQINAPWPAIFDLLEERTPRDIALLSVEPEVRRGVLRITAEARTLEALLDYAHVLRGSALVADVTLVRHETNEQDAQQPVRLSLDVVLALRAPSATTLQETAR